MKEDDDQPSTSFAPRGSRPRVQKSEPRSSRARWRLPARLSTPLLVGALLAAAIGGWWMKRPTVTSTTLPTVESSTPTAAPLSLDTGARLVIVSPEFIAELDADGRGRIIDANPSRAGDPAHERPRASDTPLVNVGAWKPLLIDAPTVNRLLSDLGRIRSSWASRTAGEAAADSGVAATGGERPLIVIEEVKSDRSTRLIFQLTASSPEYAAAGEAFTPLRLAR